MQLIQQGQIESLGRKMNDFRLNFRDFDEFRLMRQLNDIEREYARLGYDVRGREACIERDSDLHAMTVQFGKFLIREVGNHFGGINYLECAGESKAIADWAIECHETGQHCDSRDLMYAGAKYLSEHESFWDNYLKQHCRNTFIFRDELAGNWVKPHLDPTESEIEAYAERHRVPLCEMHSGIINAGAELSRRKYDLVVSVLKSGTPIAVVMSILGQPVVFVEWHKHWKRGPVRRNIGPRIELPRRADRILICESDTHTGRTVVEIAEWARQFSPSAMDFVFFQDIHGTNGRHTESVGGNFIVPWELPAEGFLDKLALVRKAAKKDRR